MDMNDTGNRIIIAVIAVLLVIGAWYLGTVHPLSSMNGGTASISTTTPASGNSTTTGTKGTSTASGPTTVATEDSVSVGNQPAGSFVMVASATLTQTGWVAIRDSDGRVLGAGLFNAGTAKAVQVPLLRNTVASQQYQALIYIDDGDRAFDLHKDTLVTNADGSVAGTTFSALNGD